MKPALHALLLADHVYTDDTTKKKIVAGIFHNLAIGQLETSPGPIEGSKKIQIPISGQVAGSPFCYISMTEVRGEQPFTLQFVNLSEDKALFQTEFKINCTNPLETIELVFPLPQLPISSAGTYALELLWGQELLGTHRIIVRHVNTPDK